MSERKSLTITQVEEIKKVGDKQIPKLSFKAKDGDGEYSYFTFKSSLFEQIKAGQTISADIEISEREWDGRPYTDRKLVQIYVDGQPVGGKGGGQFYRGKSPEELDQTAKSMALSYAKDLAVAKLISLEEITKQADTFYAWMKGNGNKPEPMSPVVNPVGKIATKQSKMPALPVKAPETDTDVSKQAIAEAWEKINKETPPTGKKVQNIAELKGLLMKHTIPTNEAYEILSIKGFLELTDLDKAWAKIKEAKGLEP